MASKYNFSASRYNRLRNYQETLEVVNCDSFDEARRIVDRAVADRELFEVEELKKIPQQGLVGQDNGWQGKIIPAGMTGLDGTGSNKVSLSGGVPAGMNIRQSSTSTQLYARTSKTSTQL